MGGTVSLINGHIDPIEKADCSKCAKTDCRYKNWFEHEMWVQQHGCKQFKSRGEQE